MKLIFLLMICAPIAFSMPKPKPGKWRILVTHEVDGKKKDIMAEAMASLDKLPAAQKKMIMEKMQDQVKISKDGTEACLSGNSFESQIKSAAKECDSKILEDSATTFKTSFVCKDGRKGESTWVLKDDTHTEGTVTSTDKNGKVYTVHQQSTFISADCGSLKPL